LSFLLQVVFRHGFVEQDQCCFESSLFGQGLILCDVGEFDVRSLFTEINFFEIGDQIHFTYLITLKQTQNYDDQAD